MQAELPFSGPVVLTGARGRIAPLLAQFLTSAGADVVSVSRAAGEGCLSYGDLRDSGILSQASGLIHCAWSSLPATAEIHPESTWTEDLPLLARLLFEIARNPNPSKTHFVFLSTSGAVYGERQTPAVETDPLRPVGWYGIGKAAADDFLRSLAPKIGVPCCILRPSNIYGFSFLPEKPQGVIGVAVRALLTGRPMRLMGGGESRKDFLHIEDFQQAVLLCLRRRLEGCYNICAGVSLSTSDVLGRIERAAGRPVPREPAPAVPWDVQSSMVSREKFSAATGWSPRVSIEEGIARTLRDAGLLREGA